MTALRAAVVVACRDRADLLDRCLRAVLAVIPEGTELVVVDSASIDPRVAEVARASATRVVRCDRPGTCRARNAGWRATDADVVLFTDDDCEPATGWVEAVLAAFADDGVGFVTGMVTRVGPDGPTALSLHLDTEPRDLGPETDVAHLGHGANLAVRRTALDSVDGFDEEMGPGTRLRAAEDKDLMVRLLSAGWRGRYEPAAGVGHVHWRGRGEALRTIHSYGVGYGALAAKVRRADVQAGRRLLHDGLWGNGLRAAGRAARDRYEFGVAAALVRTAGVARGWLRARNRPVVDGHYRNADDG